MPPAERRRHSRVRKKLLIRIRGIQGPIPPDRSDAMALIENISQGGLLVVAKSGYPAGMILRLAFPESALGPAQELYGELVRPAAPHPSGGYALALRFVAAPTPESPSPSPPVSAAPSRPAVRSPPMSGGDRRRSIRWAKQILVKYRYLSDGILRDIDPRVGILHNVSAGGLVLTVRRELPLGGLLEIHLPDTPLGPARTASATVVWSRECDGKPGQWLAGCAFEG